MTIDDFIVALEKTPKNIWYVDEFGWVRTCDSEQCPLEKIAESPKGSYRQVARSLGITYPDMHKIINAADGFNLADTKIADLRQRMLLATVNRPEPETPSLPQANGEVK